MEDAACSRISFCLRVRRGKNNERARERNCISSSSVSSADEQLARAFKPSSGLSTPPQFARSFLRDEVNSSSFSCEHGVEEATPLER